MKTIKSDVYTDSTDTPTGRQCRQDFACLFDMKGTLYIHIRYQVKIHSKIMCWLIKCHADTSSTLQNIWTKMYNVSLNNDITLQYKRV